MQPAERSFAKGNVMDASHREYFKDLLSRWLEELLNHAGSTVSVLKESDEHLSDPLDRAAFDSQCNFSLRIRDRESVLIKKILQSLEDIESGEYGICQMCGENISLARLRARPVARHCIHCKTKMENLERLTGS
jgi:DnaK suppressor protein